MFFHVHSVYRFLGFLALMTRAAGCHLVRRCAAAGSALAIVGAMRRSGEEAKGALCFPGIFPWKPENHHGISHENLHRNDILWYFFRLWLWHSQAMPWKPSPCFFQNGMAHLFLCPWESTRIYSSWDSVPRFFLDPWEVEDFSTAKKCSKNMILLSNLFIYCNCPSHITSIYKLSMKRHLSRASSTDPTKCSLCNAQTELAAVILIVMSLGLEAGPLTHWGTDGHRGMAELSGLGGIATVPLNAFSPNCDSLWHLGP